jgi:hypothetical protein
MRTYAARKKSKVNPAASPSDARIHGREKEVRTPFILGGGMKLAFRATELGAFVSYFRPKTTTEVCVPTYTLPFVTIGVMNLLAENWPLEPCVEL